MVKKTFLPASDEGKKASFCVEGLEATFRGGYWSDIGDMTRLDFALCEKCLISLIKEFKIPIAQKHFNYFQPGLKYGDDSMEESLYAINENWLESAEKRVLGLTKEPCVCPPPTNKEEYERKLEEHLDELRSILVSEEEIKQDKIRALDHNIPLSEEEVKKLRIPNGFYFETNYDGWNISYNQEAIDQASNLDIAIVEVARYVADGYFSTAVLDLVWQEVDKCNSLH
jgi:hypothetical protein